jgi:predicted MFS family arabinose efflux permease
MTTPQAVSLALGSLLVVVLSYRVIFSIMAGVTLLAAAYIAVLLRDQIRDDVRRHKQMGPEQTSGTVSAAVPRLEGNSPAHGSRQT